MKKVRYLIFILMPMLLLGIFSISPRADTSPNINPNLIYSPELFVINEGQSTYQTNQDAFEDLSMTSDFSFDRNGTVFEFRIYDIGHFVYNGYDVLVIDIMELFYIMEDREIVDNLEDLEIKFVDDYNIEYPYYYEYFDSQYFIYIGVLETLEIDRQDFTMTMTGQYDRQMVYNDQVFAHNTTIRFLKKWEDYLTIKHYYMLAVERDHDAFTNYQRGYRDGYNKGYPDGYVRGTDDDKTVAFQAGYDDGYNTGFLDGMPFGSKQAYDAGYNNGVIAGEKNALKQTTNSFMGGIEKWIVPAILIVILLGGFIAIRSNRNRGE